MIDVYEIEFVQRQTESGATVIHPRYADKYFMNINIRFMKHHCFLEQSKQRLDCSE